MQVPQGGVAGPMSAAMIYPRGKTFQAFMGPEQAAYPPIAKIVRSRGFMGAKMYFWAKRLSDKTFAVHLKEFPAQQQNW